MIGSYFCEKGRLETRDMGELIPAEGEVLIRVAACGVCGTDIHIFHGEMGSATVTPPVVLGHELAGVVERIGPGVDMLRPGDHVTVDPNIYCGVCRHCRAGNKQMCTDMRAVGVNRDGGFAEYCLSPAAQCLPLDPTLPLEHGAMAEPLACCLHGIDRAGIRPGDTVCVIGGGAIGLMMVQLARLSGASTVILSEPVESRRALGRELGADAVIDPVSENVGARVRELTAAEGAAVVIECVGSTVAVKQAFDAAGKGATVLLFSVPAPESTHVLELFPVFQKELTIRGSFVNPDTQTRAVALLNARRIRLEPLITHRFPVERTEEAIRMQMQRESIKVLVTNRLEAE